MAVELTSECLGQKPGYSYTGELEDWLLAQGYAKRAGYTGVGVSNTGATAVAPADDPTLAENRADEPYFPTTADRDSTIANDAAHLNEAQHKAPGQDFDPAGVDDDDPATDTTVTNPAPADPDFDPEA